MQRQQGLTLLELMVVLLIIGLVTTTASLALRDSTQTMVWQPSVAGYVIGFVPQAPQTTALQEAWLQAGTQATIDVPQGASSNVGVVLGPEPVLTPVQITLRLTSEKSNTEAPITLRIGTDGLRPVEVLP